MIRLRPKGNLARGQLWGLGLVAVLPLLSVAWRILALPGVLGPGLEGWGVIGGALNQALSLSAIPADQRDHVLYLLLLPTCALLVALARLTFGIRVLGFRSILISVGFHQSGIVPSLLLITIAVATIVIVRPWLRRIRLPYYGRVSVILCIVSMTMVGALLAGPWMRSDVLWGMAYFPVIVLGMLSEGIARTLDRDNVVVASWRAITTVLLAFVIALVCWLPPLRGFVLLFPEILVTQIVTIIMISEFLDLRLFDQWDARVARTLLVRRVSSDGLERVAVVSRPVGSARRIAAALTDRGHMVRIVASNASGRDELLRFLARDPRAGGAGGIVFDLARRPRRGAPTPHDPSGLEMSGVARIGPTPLSQAMALDRAVTKALLKQAGVPTPEFRVMADAGADVGALGFPAAVRPRYGPGGRPRIVQDRRQLRAAVRAVLRRHGQEAVVEECVAGRRIAVALLGNDPLECLPLVEGDPETHERVCPAPLAEDLAVSIRQCARDAFRACGCRDYARVDVCVAASGEPRVVEVRTLGLLARRGSFVRAGAEAGLTFDQLVCRIVDVARARGPSGAPRNRSRRRERRGTTTRLAPLAKSRGARPAL